jgi:hypothetical protein
MQNADCGAGDENVNTCCFEIEANEALCLNLAYQNLFRNGFKK